MKILFMCRLYYPHIGGVEKHVEKISEILSKGHQITVVTEKHDPLLPDYEIYKGVEIFRIPLPTGVGESNKKWLIWKWGFTHLNLIHKADLIHIHDVFFWFLPFRLPYWSKKVYITFHGWEGVYPIPTKNMYMHKIA